MIMKQVERDKSKGLWPRCTIMVTHTLVFFHFVFVFVCVCGFFFNLNVLEVASASVIGLLNYESCCMGSIGPIGCFHFQRTVVDIIFNIVI